MVTQQGSTERTGDRELERMPRGRQGGSRVPFVSQSLRSSSRTGCGDFIRAARVPHVELGKWGTRQAEPGPLGEHLTMGSSLQKTTGFRGESRLAVEAGLFCEALQSGARSCPQPPADTSTHPWTPQEAQRALGRRSHWPGPHMALRCVPVADGCASQKCSQRPLGPEAAPLCILTRQQLGDPTS